MALSKNYTPELKYVGGEVVNLPCSTDIIYKGAFITRDTNGDAAVVSTSNKRGLTGIAIEYLDASAASAGALRLKVLKGPFILKSVAVTGVDDSNDEGKAVWQTTDDPDDLTLTWSEDATFVGRVAKWRVSTTCDIDVFTDSFGSFALEPMAESIDMADAAHALILDGAATAAQTRLFARGMAILNVDANSGATENLTLPSEASAMARCPIIFIKNTGGESIVVLDDGGGTIGTIATALSALCICTGTASWLFILSA